MFEKWGFLLSEIWGLLVLAALIGLLAGWLIFSRRKVEVVDTSVADGLRADLGRCKARGDELSARNAALEAELAQSKRDLGLHSTRIGELKADLDACRSSKAYVVPPAAFVAPVTPVVAARPASLAAARGGQPDNLKLINGVGPVLEDLCHSLGYFHFDQIAAWTAAEIAWVDDNLEGFKGRVTRDEWVVQARDLAAGLPPREGGEH